jgi:hypothetical protein
MWVWSTTPQMHTPSAANVKTLKDRLWVLKILRTTSHTSDLWVEKWPTQGHLQSFFSSFVLFQLLPLCLHLSVSPMLFGLKLESLSWVSSWRFLGSVAAFPFLSLWLFPLCPLIVTTETQPGPVKAHRLSCRPLLVALYSAHVLGTTNLYPSFLLRPGWLPRVIAEDRILAGKARWHLDLSENVPGGRSEFILPLIFMALPASNSFDFLKHKHTLCFLPLLKQKLGRL